MQDATLGFIGLGVMGGPMWALGLGEAYPTAVLEAVRKTGLK